MKIELVISATICILQTFKIQPVHVYAQQVFSLLYTNHVFEIVSKTNSKGRCTSVGVCHRECSKRSNRDHCNQHLHAPEVRSCSCSLKFTTRPAFLRAYLMCNRVMNERGRPAAPAVLNKIYICEGECC